MSFTAKNPSKNNEFFMDIGIPVSHGALRGDAVGSWPKAVGPGKASVRIYHDAAEVIDRQWLGELALRGLLIKSAIIFYKGAGYTPAAAHTDVAVVQGGKRFMVPCAINWVIGGKGSTMRWFMDGNKSLEEITQTGGNLPIISHDTADLVELCRAEIPSNRLTLVRTDIPHMACSDAQERWCISLRFAEGLHRTWTEACDAVVSCLGHVADQTG